MGRISEVLHGLRPVILMIFVQVIYTGMYILLKLAASDGMSVKVLIAYRWIFSSAFTIPLALIFERKNRPKFTWTVVLLAFLCGLFGGFVSQNLYMESLVLTSATYVAAISNLGPAVTLILAVSLGFEKLRLKTKGGKAKVLGTLIGISGAMLITVYKGIEVKIWAVKVDILKHNNPQPEGHAGRNYIVGSAFAFCSCIFYAFWLIIQTKMNKIYPRHYSIAALTSIMASIQSVILSLSLERNWSQWKLGWNIRLFTVFYLGILSSGLAVTVITWCVRMRGPVFVASFSPLSLVLVASVVSFILEEKLYLGSIVGAAMIVCGLYMVLWGQSKEIEEKAKLVRNELTEVVHDSTSNASTHQTSSTN